MKGPEVKTWKPIHTIFYLLADLDLGSLTEIKMGKTVPVFKKFM